ncbi:MAG: CHASE domain-containing protein [Ignavibacteria bacterium]
MSFGDSNNMHSDSVTDFIRTSFRNMFVRQPGRKRIWTALVLLAGGLLLTLAAGLMVKSSVEKDAGKEFNYTCNELQNKIYARLRAHAQSLRNGAAFIENSDGVTREEWRSYYVSQKIEKNLPGIQGLGYSVIIPRNQSALHEKEIRSEGFPQYSVRPTGKREIYTPVMYVEPFSVRNLQTLGYDMFSEPVRRKAMETARDSNTAYLSEKVTLIQETNENIQAGTLMYVPVYGKSMPRKTVEERRRAIQGWVFIAYRMDVLMRGILEESEFVKIRHIRMEIFDDFSFSRDVLLYDSKKVMDVNITSSSSFFLKTHVSFNGNLWYLRFSQYDSLAPDLNYSSVWLIVAGGTGFSILLFVIYLLLINMNIRAHKLAEELTRDLSESEAKYRTIFNNEIYAVSIFDSETLKFLDVNQAYCSMYGYSREELLSGMTVDDITNEHQASVSSISRAVDQGTVFIALRYDNKKDGTVFPCEIATGSYMWKGRNVMFALMHDITERRRAEEAVKALAMRNRILLQTASDGIHIIDEQGKVVEVNAAFCSMLGYARKELLQLNVADWDAQFPAEELLPKVTELMKNPGIFTTRHRRKDGSFIDVEINGTRVTLEGRQYLYASARDITERKVAELELMKLNEDLKISKMHVDENLLQEHTLVEELTNTRGMLEEINSEKDRLFSVIAHNLKSPFQGFLGLTESMAEDIDSFSQDDLYEAAREMHVASQNIYTLLNNLLEWARMRQGMISFNPKYLFLSEIVSENINLIIKRGEQKGIGITCEVDTNRTVNADEAMLNTILRNLLSNAVKFTNQGGKVSVSSKVTENNMVEISVTDSGIGMSEKFSDRLFKTDERDGR